MLSIRLNDDNVFLRGSPDDCSGTIVSGTVVFRPSKATKVRQITLKLHGTISVDTNQDVHGDKTTVVHRTLVLFDSSTPSNPSYQFDTQEHHFDFNLPLKGDLPESIDLPHGKVTYTLSAIVIRPFPHTNLRYSQELKIQRLCYYEAFGRLKNSARGHWKHMVQYNLSVRKSVYLAGEALALAMSFQIEPGAQVIKVDLNLMETRVYKHPGTRVTLTETFDLSKAMLMSPAQSDKMRLVIPSSANTHCSTGFISVKHCVHVRVKFMDRGGKHGYVELELPIIIQSAAQYALANALPDYDDIVASRDELPPAYRPRRDLRCYLYT
ncbi:hypothetical protein K493DRAFT_303621 [Basidiobolus meristosporus CBS 931.73]|uniref:Arrestin C-terminal-like domain-containing protein n=1 Tax=Basidiobolus meristosporus CBS 931.73 TaxID=1314790 RepID=A0A1Y1Y1Z6_9FUNG|nr:hypothetical protein K493DRAFT_303621 [Basidiobolus meristosporus CBS 931.73]|eukprot:ORX92037.1 hypothetical protein K493DRAFT_303621 [Basidiobolus meristosporus CBS 931.73]